jgi:hypothetical protein
MGLCLWTAATNGPIFHPPDDIWIWKATVEWYWQGKTEELGENLSQCHFAHLKSHIDLGANLGFRGERTPTNRLSHGTAYTRFKKMCFCRSYIPVQTATMFICCRNTSVAIANKYQHSAYTYIYFRCTFKHYINARLGRYMPVYRTETYFCSWISYRHFSIYTICIYLFFPFYGISLFHF